jgi:chromosome segregation ATPase
MRERPESPTELNIPENLEEIKGELTGIFHAQGQRITEFRVVVSQRLAQIEEDLEVLLRRSRELVHRMGDLVKEAGESQGATDRFDKLQRETEAQIEDLKRLNTELGDECERLRKERDEETRSRKETTEQNEQKAEEIHRLTTEIDRLEIDNEAVRKDVGALHRVRDNLRKEVDDLQARRQDFLASIARYKEIKTGLIG